MSLKRLMLLSALAFALFFLVEAPAEAARLVRVTGEGAGEWLEQIAGSLTKFLKQLF